MSICSEEFGEVPAAAGGPINAVNRNDVLCGRGGRIAQHPGNLYFRDLVRKYRSTYLSKETKKFNKAKIASKIVETIRNLDPPGRFLKAQAKEEGTHVNDEGPTDSVHEDEEKEKEKEEETHFTGTIWIEIGDAKARKKAGQAMREKVDEGRKERKRKENTKSSMDRQQMMMMASTYATPSNVPSSYSNSSQNDISSTSPSLYDAYHNLQVSSTFPVAMNHGSNQSFEYPQNTIFVQQTAQPMNETTPSKYTHPAQSYYFGNDTSSFNQSPTSAQVANSSFSSENVDETFEPIDFLVRQKSEKSNSSSWEDSWDQGLNFEDFQPVQTSRKRGLERTESARRRQFQMMKDESSCLSLDASPITGSSSNGEAKVDGSDFNMNELMKESLVSMDLHSSSGSSGDITKKSVNMDIMQSTGDLKKSIRMESMSMNDMRMDSLLTSFTSMVMSAD